MGEISIFLAEGTAHVRQAIKLSLEYQQNLKVTGEAGNAEELLNQVCQKRPDVILLDWTLPGLHSQIVISTIRANCPGTAIIGTGVRREHSKSASDHDIDGFLHKGLPPVDFVNKLHVLFEYLNLHNKEKK